MMTLRWRVRTLLGLVVAAALGVKGVLLLRSRHNDGWERRFALAKLVEQPRPASAEADLVAALDDPGLCLTAAWALDQIGSTSPALVRVLVGNLEAVSERERFEDRRNPFGFDPAEALKRIKLPGSVIAPLLRKAMASQDPWVRLQATEVLCDAAGRPGPPSPVLATLLLAALQDREAAIRVLAPEGLAGLDEKTRQRAVAVLLQRLRGQDRPARLLATMGLARFGPEGQAAVATLADRLQGGDVATRLSDLYLLGRLGPLARPAVPAVVRAMTSPKAGQHGAYFLGYFWPRQGDWHDLEFDRILDPASERFQTPRSLCALGADVLGRIGPEADRQAIDILVGMLGGVDESQRLSAADALGAMGPRASAATPGLLALAERTTSSRPGEAEDPVFRSTRALKTVCPGDDPRLVAALIRMLKSGDRTKRWGAAMALSDLDPPAPLAAPLLLGALRDEAGAVRSWAAMTLGRYDGPEWEAASPALLDVLEDEGLWVRIWAAKSLARHRAGAIRVVPTLVRLLRSDDPNLRREAAETLGTFGPEAGFAVPVLLEARHDADELVRDAAEKALKAVDPSGAAKPVE